MLLALYPSFFQLSRGAPGEAGRESGGRVSMPGLLVFRGASGHNLGKGAPSTAPSLSLLSAPCLGIGLMISLQPLGRPHTQCQGSCPGSCGCRMPCTGLWIQLCPNHPLCTGHPHGFCRAGPEQTPAEVGSAWHGEAGYQAQAGDPPRSHSAPNKSTGCS